MFCLSPRPRVRKARRAAAVTGGGRHPWVVARSLQEARPGRRSGLSALVTGPCPHTAGVSGTSAPSLFPCAGTSSEGERPLSSEGTGGRRCLAGRTHWPRARGSRAPELGAGLSRGCFTPGRAECPSVLRTLALSTRGAWVPAGRLGESGPHMGVFQPGPHMGVSGTLHGSPCWISHGDRQPGSAHQPFVPGSPESEPPTPTPQRVRS